MVTHRDDGTWVLGAIETAGLIVGKANGTQITQIRVYSATINPASVAANISAEQTFTVTGLTTGDKVFVNPPSGIDAGLVIGGVRVSAADTLAIIFGNLTSGALDEASGSWAVVAIRS